MNVAHPNDYTDVIEYEHHGQQMSVIAGLKGKHARACLCFSGCKFFLPGQEGHCEIAAENFAMCKRRGIVAPVWECSKFEPESQEEERP